MSAFKQQNRDILELYKIAMDLYKHEDNLNWKKINMLIYANSILAAGWGFMDKSAQEFVEILSGMGMVLSVAFFITILSGVLYMQNRKNKVIAFENLMTKIFYEERELPKIVDAEKSYFRLSWTTAVVIGLPWIFFLFWLCVYLIR